MKRSIYLQYGRSQIPVFQSKIWRWAWIWDLAALLLIQNMKRNVYLPLIPVFSPIIWSATCICDIAGCKYLLFHPKYEAGHVSKAWAVVHWYYFRFIAHKNRKARAVAGVPAAGTPIWYILSRYRFVDWENRNVEVAGIETDRPSRAMLQVAVPVDQTWLMEWVAYWLAVDVPAGILAADKLEEPVDKDLIVVETYPLMKPGG